MRNYEQYFEGYNVPRKIKEITINIMRRFTIYGLCDGMYISNVIAYETGLGDGEGHFTDGEGCWNIHKIAQKLKSAYGCNIDSSDLEELEGILSGSFDEKKCKHGIQAFIKDRYEERKTCDSWRKDYVSCCIKEANLTLQELSV